MRIVCPTKYVFLAVASVLALIHCNVRVAIIVNSHPVVLLEHAHHIRIVLMDAPIAIQRHGLPIRPDMKSAQWQHATQHFAHAPRKRNTAVRRAIMGPAQTAHPGVRVAQQKII